MAIYFGADHIVWAQQAGILNNKELTDKAQKASLYGWFGGSLCTIVGEIYELAGGQLSWQYIHSAFLWDQEGV